MSPSGIVEVVLLHMESKKHHSHCGAFFVCFLIDIRRIKLSNIRPLAKVFLATDFTNSHGSLNKLVKICEIRGK